MAERALATAYVNIVPGTQLMESYLKRGLTGQAEGAGERAGAGFGSKFKGRFSSAVRGIAAPLIGAFGVVGVTQFFNSAIQGASDLNEQGAAVSQVFGSGAGAIQKFADGAATSLGQSSVQILEASKSFGIFGKAAGLTGKDNAKFSTSLVQLATDLASFNNTSVDDALIALQAGLRGESEPLRRYGVLLDDATLRQSALALGLVKTTKQALTPQQRVLAANAVIFKQTATQQGDFARTSSGLANQQRILTAEWENAKSTLGQALIPTVTSLVGKLNKEVIPAVKQFFQDFKDGKTPLNDVIDGVKGFIGYIKDNWVWISTLGAALLGAYAAVKTFTLGMEIYKGVQMAVAAVTAAYNAYLALQSGATFTATAAQFGLNAAMLASPITWIVVGIAAVVAGLVWFFTQTKLGQTLWAGFVGFLSDTMKNVGKFFGVVWEGIGSAFTGVFEFIGKSFKGYVNFWVGLINFIIGALNSIHADIPDWVPIFGGQRWGLNLPKVPMLAKGGLVTGPTQAIIGEAGPEVVTPLNDFKNMVGLNDKGAERPIYADGIGLLGWLREEAAGQATLVFNTQISKAARGAR